MYVVCTDSFYIPLKDKLLDQTFSNDYQGTVNAFHTFSYMRDIQVRRYMSDMWTTRRRR